jgi:hypothetical protein
MRSKTLAHSLASALALSLGLLSATDSKAQEDSRRDTEWRGWARALTDFFVGPEQRQEFRWSGRIAPGSTLEIKGVNGAVRAERASGMEVEVVALKRGRRHDPREVTIDMVEGNDGGLTICAVYPSPSDRPNECRPGREGRMSVRNNDVNVDFVVKVPAGVSFVGRTVNGSIQTEPLDGNVAGYTVNGSVRVSASGYARAETVNGSVQATLGKTNWSQPVAFKAVNGSVTVRLPDDASAEVLAETVNGSVSSEFSLSGVTRVSHRKLTGTLGRGGRELQIRSVNGSVRLLRRSS